MSNDQATALTDADAEIDPSDFDRKNVSVNTYSDGETPREFIDHATLGLRYYVPEGTRVRVCYQSAATGYQQRTAFSAVLEEASTEWATLSRGDLSPGVRMRVYGSGMADRSDGDVVKETDGGRRKVGEFVWAGIPSGLDPIPVVEDTEEAIAELPAAERAVIRQHAESAIGHLEAIERALSAADEASEKRLIKRKIMREYGLDPRGFDRAPTEDLGDLVAALTDAPGSSESAANAE